MIIPSLDLINGETIRLYQGSYHISSNYGNPRSHLQMYIQQGASMLHLVDLEGAKNPLKKQNILINQLIQETIPKSKIQIGGGIRTTKDIEIFLKSGATRIVLGSMAITKPKIVKKWFKHFGADSLVLAIDVRIDHTKTPKAVIHGWQTHTQISLEKIIEEYCSVGLKHILCTDISKDGTLLGSNLSLYQSICNTWPNIFVQASGGIQSLSEISKLRTLGVHSIIIGRAFLEKKFTVSEAISCWQNA